MFLFPMVCMLIVTITSLVQTLIANFKGLGAGVGIGWCVARIVLAGLLVILALILAVDRIQDSGKSEKSKIMCDYKKAPDKNGGLFVTGSCVLRHTYGIMIASYFSVKEGKRL